MISTYIERCRLHGVAAFWSSAQPRTCERAQSTVEYALVLLGAAALALLVVSWVTGTDVVGRLFEAVFGRILRQAG